MVIAGVTNSPLFVVPQTPPLLARKKTRYAPAMEKPATSRITTSWLRPARPL